MVTSQYEHITRALGTENIDILENRISGTPVPTFCKPLLRWKDPDEFIQLAPKESPTQMQMSDKAMCFVLSEHPDTANAGVDAIGKAKIDNTKFPSERQGRVAAPFGKGPQSPTPPPRQYHSKSFLGKVADDAAALGRVIVMIRWDYHDIRLQADFN
jgi:hypothetical protein